MLEEEEGVCAQAWEWADRAGGSEEAGGAPGARGVGSTELGGGARGQSITLAPQKSACGMGGWPRGGNEAAR